MLQTMKSFLKHDDDGVAAIEFAFFAIPFMLILMGIIEVGIMFGADNILQGATMNAARKVKTGQISGFSAAELKLFEDDICNSFPVIIACDGSNLTVMVYDVPDGSSLSTLYNNQTIYTGNGFSTGGGSGYVLVRVTYTYPLLTPFVGPLLSTNGNNTRDLIATAVVQNEPY